MDIVSRSYFVELPETISIGGKKLSGSPPIKDFRIKIIQKTY
jgi:hypothetical protein